MVYAMQALYVTLCIMATEFVEGGGSYLGFCAGAYFACSEVDFEPGTDLAV